MTDTPISRAAVLAILRSPKASDTFPDMISRVEALEGVGVRVKPLVWEGTKAMTPFGEYYFYLHTQRLWILRFDGRMVRGFETVYCDDIPTAAKAAAQADYTARVMAALEPMEPRDE